MPTHSRPDSIQDFLLARDPGLRFDVAPHHDRTMTVTSLGGSETITRCGICPKDVEPPCTGLRILALPYADHPDFRPEWQVPVEPEDAPIRASGESVVGEQVPPEYPRIIDIPPPGNARRRLLRDFAIRISRDDYTDEELAQRMIPREHRGRPRQAD